MPDRAKVYTLPEGDSDEQLLTKEKSDVRADPVDAGKEVELCGIPKEQKRSNDERTFPKERKADKKNITKAAQKKKETTKRKESMIPDDLSMATSTEVDDAPKRFYFAPQSRFRRRWDVIMLYLLLYTAVVTPFEVSILELHTETTEFWTMIAINFMVNLLFIVDMLRSIRFVTWGYRQ